MLNERSSVKEQQFFVDVGGPMKHSSLGGKNYVAIFVGEYTRFKVVKFVKTKSNTTAVLLSLIGTSQELLIKWIRTGNGGKFDREF